MSVLRTAGVVALIVVARVAAAEAQVHGFAQLGGGLAVPVGNYKDEGAKTGWTGQVAGALTYGMMGARISGTYTRNGFEGLDEHFRILGAMADFMVSPSTGGSIAPYFLAGIGFQNGKASFTGAEGETKFAWNAGAGLGVKVGGIGLFLEARYLSIRTPVDATNLIPITVGVLLGR